MKPGPAPANAPAIPIKAKQIRPELAAALKLIVTEGYSIKDAAEFVGYATESLRIALHKPHVIAEKKRVKDAWMQSQTAKAWQTVAQLAAGAASEQVRLAAAKTFLEAQGELGAPKDVEQHAQTLIQIVAQAGSTIALPDDRGVIQRPAIDAQFELIEGPDDDADDEP